MTCGAHVGGGVHCTAVLDPYGNCPRAYNHTRQETQ